MLGPTGKSVYMDYQASTPVDPRVFEAMAPYFMDHPGNPHSSDHAFGWRAHAAIEAALEKIGKVIHVDPDEIIFTSGATESNNLAILGLAARAQGKKRILVSSIEHKCVLAAASATKRFGLSVEHIAVDCEGYVRPALLERALSNDVLLVSVMAANNEIGSVQPLCEIAEICHRYGALVHTDASQILTTCDFDIPRLDIDLASFSGHKIYGPKGVGALYIRREVQSELEPLIFGGGQQSGLRSGTLPVPLCVGLGEAMAIYGDAAVASVDRKKTRDLRDAFLLGLADIAPRHRLNGPAKDFRHACNANVLLPNIDARDFLSVLQPKVAASTGSACGSGMTEPSHVLRALGLSDADAGASVRFSVGRYTTRADISLALTAIAEALTSVEACA